MAQQNDQTEIKYGHVQLPFGKDKAMIRCGYCIFKEEGHMIELISVPYGGLYVRKDGELIGKPGQSAGRKYVMAWTRVAGWLGADELMSQVRASM